MAGNPIKTLKHGETLSYCCSWASQNFVAKNKAFGKGAKPEDFFGALGSKLARAEMNEETIFGEGGFADQFPELRGDLYFVLDDGWDVPFTINPDVEIHMFGSLEIDPERFPSLRGTPAERLHQLNERIKALGWRGAGLWIAPQISGERYDDPAWDYAKHEAYWRERILWCKYADIRYWKVDWGKHSGKAEYREMMTRLGHELFPELIMEHACCLAPVNGVIPEGKIRYEDFPKIARIRAISGFSDAFRSYDVTDDMLSATSTLDRLSTLLETAVGIVNCEDELYMGAALGCSVGIMRSAYGKNLFRMCTRLDEITATVKWQRVAPPFAGGELLRSENVLVDSCYYSEEDTWFCDIMNKTVEQAAPAVIARNTPLPLVESDERAPFVIASKNPSGAYSLAAIRRRMALESTTSPRVTCFAADAERVGIFGSFASVTLQFDRPVASVTAQSLIRGQALTLDAAKTVNGSTVTLSGALLASLDTTEDNSENAVMVTVEFAEN
ncbi:MAG: hypothetical protein IKJ35_01705 [Clostridia bacterium]|nr:hypothetical protein [Clostridia bacterium]